MFDDKSYWFSKGALCFLEQNWQFYATISHKKNFLVLFSELNEYPAQYGFSYCLSSVNVVEDPWRHPLNGQAGELAHVDIELDWFVVGQVILLVAITGESDSKNKGSILFSAHGSFASAWALLLESWTIQPCVTRTSFRSQLTKAMNSCREELRTFWGKWMSIPNRIIESRCQKSCYFNMQPKFIQRLLKLASLLKDSSQPRKMSHIS